MERQATIAFSDDEESNVWGKLVSLSTKFPNKSLTANEYTFGRSASNSVVIQDKRLSGTHTKVTKESDGKVYVTDLSTNGTFHEDAKLGKDVKKELKSGDKFYLLHPSKVSQDDIIGYAFSFGNEETSEKRDREESKAAETNGASAAANAELQKQLKLTDELGEEMQCSICIDYIYQCVTLMPCLHNFCAACFSDWVKKSDLCPQCREEVFELKKNPTINSMISKFLDAHPDKKRSKQEYDLMDSSNRFKEDRVKLKTAPPPTAAPKGGKRKPEPEEEKDDGNTCAECKNARSQDGFKCDRANRKHLNCSACKQLFPDRRDTQPQECTICNTVYCNLYMKCSSRRADKLTEFQNLDVLPNLQDSIFRGNKMEVKFLRDFLTNKRYNCRNLFQDFLKEVVDKNNFKYKVNKSILAAPPPVSFEVAVQRTSPICTKCVEGVWYQVVFRYREHVKSQLPSTVRDRTKCWYGLNCKTMIHNEDHAKKLDHICEQTKF